MKTLRTISIDIDVWTKAQSMFDNMSGEIQELLIQAINNRENNGEEQTTEELQKLVKGHEKTIAVLKAELEKKKSTKEEGKFPLTFEMKRAMEAGMWEK